MWFTKRTEDGKTGLVRERTKKAKHSTFGDYHGQWSEEGGIVQQCQQMECMD